MRISDAISLDSSGLTIFASPRRQKLGNHFLQGVDDILPLSPLGEFLQLSIFKE